MAGCQDSAWYGFRGKVTGAGGEGATMSRGVMAIPPFSRNPVFPIESSPTVGRCPWKRESRPIGSDRPSRVLREHPIASSWTS